MNEKEFEKRVAEKIHYPQCWDTAAYPTLLSALWECIIPSQKICNPEYCCMIDPEITDKYPKLETEKCLHLHCKSIENDVMCEDCGAIL